VGYGLFVFGAVQGHLVCEHIKSAVWNIIYKLPFQACKFVKNDRWRGGGYVLVGFNVDKFINELKCHYNNLEKEFGIFCLSKASACLNKRFNVDENKDLCVEALGIYEGGKTAGNW
jgi:hypothetical protein